MVTDAAGRIRRRVFASIATALAAVLMFNAPAYAASRSWSASFVQQVDTQSWAQSTGTVMTQITCGSGNRTFETGLWKRGSLGIWQLQSRQTKTCSSGRVLTYEWGTRGDGTWRLRLSKTNDGVIQTVTGVTWYPAP